MAFRDIAQSVKNFFGPNNKFFNGSREDESPEDYYPPQSGPAVPAYHPDPQPTPQPQSYPPQSGPQQGYPQTYTQGTQPYPANGYPQPQPQTTQYVTQAGVQQVTQPQGYGIDQQTVNQPYTQPRNRRSNHPHTAENVVQFPVTPEQQPVEQPAAKKQLSTCVINVRSIADCRSAIGILRTGDCVIAVMDSIADQSEVRRYVDTLNGACFSLGCTMTRTSSRVGVYFLAPSDVRVLTDQTTTQMNSQSRAPQRARSAQPVFQSQNPYQAQQPAYRPTYAPGYQQPYAAPVQQPVYQQPQPSFSAQQPAQGYAPDQEAADAVM